MSGMRKTSVLTLMALVAAAALGVTGWMIHRAAQPVEIALHFHPFVGAEPLVLNDTRYANPGGEGRFRIRDFQFFLSNIGLVGATGTYVEADSYHLVRFDGDEPGFVILLRGVPRRKYERIEFGIGVDAAANGSLAQRGDLDPNGRMAWNWEVGYKFVLVEGALVRGDASDPLVYHVGFSENYRPVTVALDRDLLDSRAVRLDFRVDILRLFKGSTTVDMAALPSVKFDRADSALLAGNFDRLVEMMAADSATRADADR